MGNIIRGNNMDILKSLQELGGYWKYSGGKYLAKLTSGEVSDTYANLSVLTCRPWGLDLAVHALTNKLCGATDEGIYVDRDVDTNKSPLYVCGLAMGGVTLAYEVARQLGGTAIFTEPTYEADCPEHDIYSACVVKTGQQLKRFEIPEGAMVLFVTNQVMTGKSIREMAATLSDYHGGDANMVATKFKILPYVLCLANSSPHDGLFLPWLGDCLERPTVLNAEIISLADVQARTWHHIDEIEEDFWIHHATAKWGVQNRMTVEAVCPKDNWNLLTGVER